MYISTIFDDQEGRLHHPQGESNMLLMQSMLLMSFRVKKMNQEKDREESTCRESRRRSGKTPIFFLTKLASTLVWKLLMWKGSKNRWKVDTVLEDAQVIGVGKDSTWKCKPIRMFIRSVLKIARYGIMGSGKLFLFCKAEFKYFELHTPPPRDHQFRAFQFQFPTFIRHPLTF